MSAYFDIQLTLSNYCVALIPCEWTEVRLPLNEQ